jgi:hypothetical protein
MMKSVALGALVFTLSACGSTAPPAAEQASTPTTEPVPTSRNIITEGVHDKRVGQPGGFGCGAGPDATCDTTFTVTAIELNPPCAEAAPPTQRLLRIEVDVEAAVAFQYEQPETALTLRNWAVETPGGAMHYDLKMIDQCSPDPGVFVGDLVPGTHPRDSVVIVAPETATWLWLGYEQTAYRWPIRPPV